MQIYPIREDNSLFLSPVIDDWAVVEANRISAVVDLEGGIDRGVPTHPNHLLYVYFPIADRMQGAATQAMPLRIAEEPERSRRPDAAATSWWPASCAQRPQGKSNRLRLSFSSGPFRRKPSREAGHAACNLFSAPC
jgi:hypothetical protein